MDINGLTLLVGFGAGVPTGLIAGTPIGALFMRVYCDLRHGKDVEAVKQAGAETAKVHYNLGLEKGKTSIQSYVDFRMVGFFRPRLEHIHVVYDASERRVLHLTGHYANFQLFANIPPEVKKAIESVCVQLVPSQVHVSLKKAPSPMPPKSTTFPAAPSQAIPAEASSLSVAVCAANSAPESS